MRYCITRNPPAHRTSGDFRTVLTLGVNIDHVATIRQARQAHEPNPIAAALLAELAGADGITAHLREDRRHIQDRDVRLLRETVATHLNLEMAATEEMVSIERIPRTCWALLSHSMRSLVMSQI